MQVQQIGNDAGLADWHRTGILLRVEVMKNTHYSFVSLFLILTALMVSSCTKPKPEPEAAPELVEKPAQKEIVAADCLIRADSVGLIKLGMTIADARKAAKTLNFKRTSDGEGVALVQVSLGNVVVMTVFAGEKEVAEAIDEKAKIELIEVWDSSCKTAEGVHPNMLLSDVEKAYGKVTSIMKTEIESREYATFANQPKGLSFRLNEGAVYPSGTNQASRHDAKTTLMRISIRK